MLERFELLNRSWVLTTKFVSLVPQGSKVSTQSSTVKPQARISVLLLRHQMLEVLTGLVGRS